MTIATKMNDDELAKESLDRVSGQLRKAVGLNRHEMGGLRNIVSQMKRDRNKSMGLLSKKQQEFLQKQAKLLPAINLRRKSRKISNQVIPLSQENIGSSKGSSCSPKLGLNSSTQFHVLPPIRTSGNSVRDSGATDSEAKLRRISDYQKEFSSLQESISNAHKFARSSSTESLSPVRDKRQNYLDEENIAKPNQRRFLQSLSETDEIFSGESSRQFSNELSRVGKEGLKTHRKSQKRVNDTNPVETDTRSKSSLKNTLPLTSSIDEVALANKPFVEGINDSVIFEEEEKEKKNYWGFVRERLGVIAAMNKKRHSQYLEQLYQEIRKCRYIRKPKKRNPSTGLWYESGEESENEET